MNINSDLSSLTDLAVEARNLAVERTGGEISGVSVEEFEADQAEITRIEVLNEAGAQQIGKPVGNYITITSDQLRTTNRPVHEDISAILAQELNNLIDYSSLAKTNSAPTILVIGLGNWNATPDALGPGVVDQLLVTRHLDEAGDLNHQNLRPVCALAPGVLGLTGIETAEIIRGVVDRVGPDLIIAIDSLAARDSNRLASTVQISDTGIYPGSGVGKERIGVTKEDMGVPVIAVGTPTVINSVNIVQETIDKLATKEDLSVDYNSDPQQIITEVLKPYMGDLVVAPKGIDQLIRDTSRVIGGGINVALHPDITPDEVALYLQ